MRLHHFAHSSASFRVRTVLAFKGIEVEYIRVDMPSRAQQGPAYAKINPQRMVPALELDDGRVLGQSLAMIELLDTLYPEPPLYPSDPVERGFAQSLVHMIACDTSPLQAKLIQRALMGEFGLDAEANQRWISKWILRGLSEVERVLCARTVPSRFALSDLPGIVDVMVIPQVRNAQRFGVDITHMPELLRLNENCLAHPAFVAAHPDRWDGLA